jgi:hypothetical protein
LTGVEARLDTFGVTEELQSRLNMSLRDLRGEGVVGVVGASDLGVFQVETASVAAGTLICSRDGPDELNEELRGGLSMRANGTSLQVRSGQGQRKEISG